MKYLIIALSVLMVACQQQPAGPVLQGKIMDESSNPAAGLTVYVVEDTVSTVTDEQGVFKLSLKDGENKTVRLEGEGYMFEQHEGVSVSESLNTSVRRAIKSAATLREEIYLTNDCQVDIPDNPEWDVEFKEIPLKGDLAPDTMYTRRDPSAVIKVDDTYYVWYSWSMTHGEGKIAPWDLNDLYYATSKDGITWKEEGIAVGRGEPGSFDHRSVFTTEIFVDNGKYYLVYQAAAGEDGVYNRNVVGMSVADSPDGPWTKLKDPVLRPTYTDNKFFDNNAVHDPCIVAYDGKYHLYYKGECNCMGDPDCIRWCNPVCGLKKQVKWGVAVADSPTGPFEKSVFNPITNTGHEVMVWTYGTGVAILQHQDGPEANTIQYSEDGFNFEIMGSVKGIPEASGLYRPNDPADHQHAGIEWGLSHKLNWDAGPRGWMYIRRFDLVKK
ncbi:MAG: family 43 glycosylhydrolase [Cyclobacteriaceae bacterium]